MFTHQQLRQKYLDFFSAQGGSALGGQSKGHTIIPSASLIPENDPTVLFTTAGMHPLVPYLLGEKHAGGKRVTSCQKCVRTDDIDEVGDATHHTFFEMLGNWSFNDYFKEEAIKMSWEFLTSKNCLGLDPKRLAVSVFMGDADAPFDQESFDLWKKLGVPEKRIAKLPKKNNWWGPAGQTGPCGPDTEMFYWVGDSDKVPESFNDDNVLWVEIWNDVFMQYNKKAEGVYEPLKQKNVDTGMGLERTLAVLNGFDDNYQTELFWPIILKVEEISGREYIENKDITKSMRVIADHIRSAVMIMGDDMGVGPSNTDQGYVVRRLIRRAIRHGRTLGIKENFCPEIAEEVIQIFADVYPEVERNRQFVITEIAKEESKFRNTLEEGIKKFEELKLKIEDFKISGINVFDLYQSFGFPLEMTIELAKEKGLQVDVDGFEEEMKKHQELSRAGAEQKFKGGLADTSEISTKYHTATHLLLAALNKVLGEGIYQRGSNITTERLRFDFNWPEKLTAEQIKAVEDLVNEKIKADLQVVMTEMPKDSALKEVKVSFDPSKYPDMVKVYKIGEFSVELCGGPHVEYIGVLGKFTIIKEEASSSGVRRIKAILE